MSYYSKHAKEYIDRTINVDMRDYYSIFLGYIESSSKILDVGFGSGRDSLYFSKLGYEVTSIDPIKEFCENGINLGLKDVKQMSIEDITYLNQFNGIWACASLLHLESSKLVDVFNKCYSSLKDNGVMYVSFKYGDYEGYIEDRYFTYLKEESFKDIISKTNFKIEKLWINESDKLNRDIKWLNIILRK